MSWYKTGTCAVTNGSPTVTGSGTAWAANIRQGWGFIGPDGKTYEVLSVNSNTSITLARNYAGSTLSGQQYDLFPTQGEINTLAAQVAALISSYSGVLTGAGAGKFSAGSAAAPGVSETTDTDTGLAWLAANVLALITGGSERARVDAGGRLLVGGTTAFSPSYTVMPALQVQGNSFSAQTASVQAFSADNNGANAYFSKSRSGTVGTHTIVQSGDILGSIRFAGSDGVASIPGAQITAQVDGTPGVDDMPGRLMFSTTADNSASLVERMRISSSGYLGQRVSDPQYYYDMRAINYSASQAAQGLALRGTSSVDLTGAGWLGGLFMEANGTGQNSISLYGPNVTTAGAVSMQKAVEVFGSGAAQDVNIYAGGVLAANFDGASGTMILTVPASAPSLASNSNMVFSLTSNTNLRVSVRGTDGTTRVANLTLA